MKIVYDNFELDFTDELDHRKQLAFYNLLKARGWKMLGIEADMPVFAVGAWLQDQDTGLVLCMQDCSPYWDARWNKVLFPDPIGMPLADKTVMLTIYIGPFFASLEDGKHWEMNGKSPFDVHHENLPVGELIFETPSKAFAFSDWVLAHTVRRPKSFKELLEKFAK